MCQTCVKIKFLELLYLETPIDILLEKTEVHKVQEGTCAPVATLALTVLIDYVNTYTYTNSNN
jgi:hypothetical protein